MLLPAKVKPTKISLKYFKNTSKLNDFFVIKLWSSWMSSWSFQLISLNVFTEMEAAAMEELYTMIGDKDISEELRELFDEYEEQSSPEALFVKDIDRFEMILQAKEYEDSEKGAGKLQDFFDGVEGKFKTETGKKLADTLTEERSSCMKNSWTWTAGGF